VRRSSSVSVEPAIGGVEVGIIGAFEAVVVDDGAL
jgi:hypothetical protein